MRKRSFVMPGFRPMPVGERDARPSPWDRALLERERHDLQAYQPLSDWYRVELIAKAQQTPGGIWLPDTVRLNWTDARVLASGPGQRLADGSRSVMWVDPGDRVLFMKHTLKNLQAETRQGMVSDSDLIAVQRESTDAPEIPEPLNGWCLIEPAPWEEKASAHILWAEEDRPRPLHGRLFSYGPGEVRRTGPLAGLRKPVWEVFGFTEEQVAENLLTGAHVFWDRACQALAIGRRELEFILIQASDLWGYQLDAPLEHSDLDSSTTR